MIKNWKIAEADPHKKQSIAKELGISTHLAHILLNRGITTAGEAENFLKANLSSLYDAKLLPDIGKAVQRIFKALKNKEKVLIFSDYDADGITALVVMKNAFDKLGITYQSRLPHRLKEGYGLNHDVVKYAYDNGIKLLVTLDCGVSNIEEISRLNKLNIDTIVVDHHNPHDNKLPDAFALVNPKCGGSNYPFKDLSAVGLSYKLASCLLGGPLRAQLDLACIGTVADIVPLAGENRIIVKEGLKELNPARRIGINSLIEAAGIENKLITAQTVSFIIAPRINACGRIDSAETAFNLLITDSRLEAMELAKKLNSSNQQRQRIETRILEDAAMRLDRGEVDFSKERVIVLHQEGWHQGVLGIVASRIANKFYRPTVIISCSGGIGRGSARSIRDFHLFDSLLKCREHLQSFGGHKYAAGLNILEKDIPGFKDSINKIAFEVLSAEHLVPSLDIDLELELRDLSLGLMDEISLLEPFGQDNPQPLFASYGLQLKSKPSILARDTLKFWVTDGEATYPAVGFKMGEYFDLVSSAKNIDLAYKISLDTWGGKNELQLEVKDIKIGTHPIF